MVKSLGYRALIDAYDGWYCHSGCNLWQIFHRLTMKSTVYWKSWNIAYITGHDTGCINGLAYLIAVLINISVSKSNLNIWSQENMPKCFVRLVHDHDRKCSEAVVAAHNHYIKYSKRTSPGIFTEVVMMIL